MRDHREKRAIVQGPWHMDHRIVSVSYGSIYLVELFSRPGKYFVGGASPTVEILGGASLTVPTNQKSGVGPLGSSQNSDEPHTNVFCLWIKKMIGMKYFYWVIINIKFDYIGR